MLLQKRLNLKLHKSGYKLDNLILKRDLKLKNQILDKLNKRLNNKNWHNKNIMPELLKLKQN